MKPELLSQVSDWKLAIDEIGKHKYKVKFTKSNTAIKKSVKIYAAILAFDVATNVLAGENKGKNLKHDFLVIEWKHKIVAEGSQTVDFDFDDVLKNNKIKKLAIVSWLEGLDEPVSLQSVGGYL